jgi:hypothetical protein
MCTVKTTPENEQLQSEPKPKTCPLAALSLGFGIAGLVVICIGILLAIPAIILGHVASSRIKKSGGLLKGRSLAATGTFLGYFVIICWCLTIYMMNFKKYEVRQFGFQRNHVWQNAEVGIIFNLPIGKLIPNGRYYSVVAFPSGRTNDQVVLYEGPRGEVPRPPKFISGAGNIVTYEVPDGGTTNLVIPEKVCISEEAIPKPASR